MDLLGTLGISTQEALLAAGAGLVVALVWAGSMLFRRSRGEPKGALGLHDR